MKQSPSRAVLSALVAMAGINMIWGMAFPITKPALADVPPVSFAFWRFVISLSILLPLSFRQTWALLRGPERNQMLVMGALGFGVTQITQVYALYFSPATHIALLSTTTPLWVAFLASWWLNEPFTRRMLAGTLIALVGVIIVLNPSDGLVTDWRVWLGYGIYMISAFGWAAYNVMGRDMMQRHPPLPTTAAAATVGVVSLFPFMIGEYVWGMPTRITVPMVTGIVYTGIFVTVVGYLTLFWALTKSTSSNVAAMMYFQPIAGAALAWVWLNEQQPPAFFIGSVLTFVGVWLVIGQQAKPPADTTTTAHL